jgi:hypothetical protein
MTAGLGFVHSEAESSRAPQHSAFRLVKHASEQLSDGATQYYFQRKCSSQRGFTVEAFVTNDSCSADAAHEKSDFVL